MHDIVVPEVEALFVMPDEKDKSKGGWQMPDPVFRSTEGRDLKAESDLQSEIPTEPADRDLTTEASLHISQNVRAKENRRIRHKNKRKKSFWERNAAGLIV